MKRYSAILFLFILACEPKDNSNEFMVTEKWISIDGPRSEVWFQDWSGYMRLFVTTFSDTDSVDPGPYITETKNKPYLTPKPYELVNKRQLIGNVDWDQDFLWDPHLRIMITIIMSELQ